MLVDHNVSVYGSGSDEEGRARRYAHCLTCGWETDISTDEAAVLKALQKHVREVGKVPFVAAKVHPRKIMGPATDPEPPDPAEVV
ncbi:hypothetical protein [Sphaerisporangium perillae]|uniref:hypothetical protein n=1 Tax=Sphaerisporangium perillae TaxID=2935860 RepID=UPI00200C08BB|nr:hypothetical protein [Sphaerisporangium perillae]